MYVINLLVYENLTVRGRMADLTGEVIRSFFAFINGLLSAYQLV